MQIPRGAQLLVLDGSDAWCRVVYKEVGGYVMTSFLSFEGAPAALSADESETEESPAETSKEEPAKEESEEKSEGENHLPIEDTTEQPPEEQAPENGDTPRATLSEEMEVLAQHIPVTVSPKTGSECPVFSEMDENSRVLETLQEETEVLLWMKGPDWCLVQYDAEDASKLAYIRTHHLQMTGE